jgi:hypothetical protein
VEEPLDAARPQRRAEPRGGLALGVSHLQPARDLLGAVVREALERADPGQVVVGISLGGHARP